MRFIKKLIILSGKERGSLMLEKNGYGVFGKLSIGSLGGKKLRIIVISGGDAFMTTVNGEKVKLEMGDIDYDEIHAAIISETEVLMYGSNCAAKLSAERIMQEATALSRKAGDSAIRYSGTQSPSDYFKTIKPYDDYAIAEKNYFDIRLSPSAERSSVSVDNTNLQGDTTARMESTQRAESENDKSVIFDGDLFYDVCRRAVFGADSSERNPHFTTFAQPESSETQHGSAQDNKQNDNEATVRQTVVAELNGNENVSCVSADKRETKQAAKQNIKQNAELKRTEDETKLDEGARRFADSDCKETQNDALVLKTNKPQRRSRSLKTEQKDSKVSFVAASEEKTMIVGREATFYEKNDGKVKKLFSSYERCKEIEEVIPGSRFVKIMYDEKRYYVVGLVDDYICYGVPCDSERLPEAFSGYATYIGVSGGRGYYMLYQDGVTGKTVCKKS